MTDPQIPSKNSTRKQFLFLLLIELLLLAGSTSGGLLSTWPTPIAFIFAAISFVLLLALGCTFVFYRQQKIVPTPPSTNPDKPSSKPAKTLEAYTDRHGRRTMLETASKVVVQAPPPIDTTIGLTDAWDPFEEISQGDLFTAESLQATKTPVPITERYRRVLDTVETLGVGSTAIIDLTGDSDKELKRIIVVLERMRGLKATSGDLVENATQAALLIDGIARQSQSAQVRILYRTLVLGGPESHWLYTVHLPSVVESIKRGNRENAKKILENISRLLSVIHRRKRMVIVRITDPRLQHPDIVVGHVPAMRAWQ